MFSLNFSFIYGFTRCWVCSLLYMDYQRNSSTLLFIIKMMKFALIFRTFTFYFDSVIINTPTFDCGKSYRISMEENIGWVHYISWVLPIWNFCPPSKSHDLRGTIVLNWGMTSSKVLYLNPHGKLSGAHLLLQFDFIFVTIHVFHRLWVWSWSQTMDISFK